MLRLNINKEKKLTFEIQLGGISYDQIESSFVIEFDNIKYSFPGVVTHESVTISLPILKSIIRKKISEGDEANVKLEIVADGHILTPWKDRVLLSNPVIVEVKIKDPDIFTNTLNEEVKPQVVIPHVPVIKEEKRVELNEDVITQNIISKLSEKLDNIINKKNLQEEKVTDSQKHTEGEGTEQGGTGDKTIPGAKKDAKKEITKEQNNRINKIKNFKKNLTEDIIKAYIQKKIPKDENIRDLVFEQAKISAGGNALLADVLVEVSKILNSKKENI